MTAKLAAAQAASPKTSAAKASPEPPHVGRELAALRRTQHLSLDALSAKSGVSKSMLSQIERGRTNPTVAVVWKLANALGVPVMALFGEPAEAPATVQMMAAEQVPSIHSADRKCELRILSPVDTAGQFEWYELIFQPGGALRSEAHEPGAREHLTVLKGTLTVDVDGNHSMVRQKQTVRYSADRRHAITNTTSSVVTALLVVACGARRT